MIRIFCTVISFFCIVHAHAQTPGLIYKPSTTAFGRSVLDPNGDGFTSPTNVGFITTDFGSGSELPMIPLPVIQGEPHSDLTTGASGGHTDIVSFPVGGQASNQSCYILYRTVNGVPYVLIRMRIGKASTSPKGYSFLLNTDGNFNTGSSGNNPGYDKEIVLQTGNPGLVAVYTHSGSATTLSASFPAAEYSQYSVALSANNGNPDYFYDFFVPFSSLGIAQNPVGITAVTVTSAGSGITGTISDFNGVNDQLYGGNPTAIMNALISSFPAIPLTELTEDFNPNTWLAQTLAPQIGENVLPGNNQTVVGTSIEANGTQIILYLNGVPICTTTVNNGSWSCSGINLAPGNALTATAHAAGKSLSVLSTTVIVPSAFQDCFIQAPINLNRNTSNNSITGSWSGSFSPNGSNVRIDLYTQTGPNPGDIILFSIPGGSDPFVQSNGTFSIATGLSNNAFGSTNFIAKAVNVATGCQSGFSNVTIRTSGNSADIGFITPRPTITTSPIFQNSSAQSIVVANNGADCGQTLNGVTISSSPFSAVLILYVNGTEVTRTSSAIASNASHTFSVSGLFEGDVVTARAQGTATNHWLSYVSNSVVVGLQSTSQTLAPTITGTYTAGSGKTITGTSLEPAGTVITVYRNGVLIGTVTVSAYGTWQLTNQTLSTYDVLTAFAKANGKSLSAVSNSVTVQASAPSAPTVTGNYVVGNTTISGGSGNTLVRIYVDGTIIGTATPVSGAWSLTGIAPGELYRGAIIHATNMVNGIESPISNEKEVTGVASFVITRPNGSPLGTVVSGDTLNIRIKAKEGLNGGGNDFTAFNNNVTLSATIPVIDGSGPTENFSNGVLGSNPGEKNITVGGAGSNKKVLVVNPNDPTAFGEADIEVLPALWRGRIDQNTAIDNTGHNKPANWAHNRIPASGANVKFADDAVQDMEIEDDYTWNDLDFNNKPFHVLIKDKNLKLNSISQRDGNEFKTTGNGSLIMEIEPGQSRVFYVANSGSNYLRITNTDNTSQDPVTFSVRVFDNFLTNGTSGGTVAIDDRVNRTWMISNNNPGFISSVELTFEWLPNHQSNSMGGYKLYHYENNTWNQVGNLDFSEVEGIRKGTIQYTGTFSPFAIGAPSALPVEYLGMRVICESDYVNVNWSTASEYNASHFDIETSSDGFNWSVSAAVAANGTTNQLSTYSHSIRNVPGILYYRLTQFDFDGKNETFVPVYHDCSRAGNRLIVYPNPASSNIHILIQAEENMDHAELEILDMFGRVIVKTPVTVKSGSIAIQLDIDTLSSGVYLVRLKNTHSNFETFKFIKE
jgi:hypothetical protein